MVTSHCWFKESVQINMFVPYLVDSLKGSPEASFCSFHDDSYHMSHIYIDSKSIEDDVIQNQSRSMSERSRPEVNLLVVWTWKREQMTKMQERLNVTELETSSSSNQLSQLQIENNNLSKENEELLASAKVSAAENERLKAELDQNKLENDRIREESGWDYLPKELILKIAQE